VAVFPVQTSLFTPSPHCPASVVGQLAKGVPTSPHVAFVSAVTEVEIDPGHTPPVQLVLAVHEIQGTDGHCSMQQADQEGLAIARTARTVIPTKTMHLALICASFRLDLSTGSLSPGGLISRKRRAVKAKSERVVVHFAFKRRCRRFRSSIPEQAWAYSAHEDAKASRR
jgi:hypothetical protein